MEPATQETATESADGLDQVATRLDAVEAAIKALASPSTPYYAGVPARVILAAVADLGLPDLLVREDWS